MSQGCLGVSGGVWGMSGGCLQGDWGGMFLRDVWGCLGVSWGMSVEYLVDVWGMHGECLGDVWVVSGGVSGGVI